MNTFKVIHTQTGKKVTRRREYDFNTLHEAQAKILTLSVTSTLTQDNSKLELMINGKTV